MTDTRATILSDLIARIAKGDRHAFDALYQATSARLNAICLSVLRDRRRAEEALEQTYIDIWRNAKTFAASGLSPMAWLATGARACAVGRLGPDQPPEGTGGTAHPAEAVRVAYLQGLDEAGFAVRAGVPVETARQRLRDGLTDMGAGDGPDDMLAAELAAGLLAAPEAKAASSRAASDPGFARLVRDWQERLARLADDLIPVMAPARARQRIRESLGHGVAPLSVDPLERPSRWRGMAGFLAAVLLAAAAWYVWLR